MKRWKKILLALLGVALLSQIPFAYRRYRLGRLRAAIEALNAQRSPAADERFDEYAGVFHVHSWIGGHSSGNFDEIVGAAKANGLAFVVMTEHPSRYVNTAEATLKGVRDGVLFVNGSELTAAGGVRLFVLPGLAQPDPPTDAQDLVTRARSEGRLAIVAYPEEVRDWQFRGYDGIEVYNLYTNTNEVNYVLLFFDMLWSYRSYPELMFSTFYAKPDGGLKKWDELNAAGGSRLAAIAGNDSHANVGLSLRERTGDEILGVGLDPYERSFRVVRNHVLLEKGTALNTETLLDALRRGRSFIAFDLFGDAGGFRFTAETAAEKKVLGDDIALTPPGAPQAGVRLKATTPVRGRVVFLRDGQVVGEERDTEEAELTVERAGAYRVEVYLEQLPKPLGEKPWIISNPIYVR